MLIDTFREAYREFTGKLMSTESVSSVHTRRPAANAGNFAGSEIQARRHRRQRRLDRSGSFGIGGWKVRTW